MKTQFNEYLEAVQPKGKSIEEIIANAAMSSEVHSAIKNMEQNGGDWKNTSIGKKLRHIERQWQSQQITTTEFMKTAREIAAASKRMESLPEEVIGEMALRVQAIQPGQISYQYTPGAGEQTRSGTIAITDLQKVELKNIRDLLDKARIKADAQNFNDLFGQYKSAVITDQSVNLIPKDVDQYAKGKKSGGVNIDPKKVEQQKKEQEWKGVVQK